MNYGKDNSAGGYVINFAWFQEKQWKLLRNISTDPDALERTHQQWANNATVFLAEMEEHGYATQKVPVDVVSIFEWCHSRGKAMDAEGRAAYFEQEAMHDVWQVCSLA